MYFNYILVFEVLNICIVKIFVMKVDMINCGEEYVFIIVCFFVIVYFELGMFWFLLSVY